MNTVLTQTELALITIAVIFITGMLYAAFYDDKEYFWCWQYLLTAGIVTMIVVAGLIDWYKERRGDLNEKIFSYCR